MTQFTRLPLKGSYNTRELGGYPTKTGVTNFQQFIRSDSISSLTTQDLDFLNDYGIRIIIDLRSEEEIVEAPNPVHQSIINKHIPLITGDVADITKDLSEGTQVSMGKFYIDILKNYPKNVVEVFETFLQTDQGVLFHCSAGKDRTGIVAAFLLDLAGVCEADIIANYQLTYTYLKSNHAFVESLRTYPKELLYSLPNYMEELLGYLYEEYGSAENYLSMFGLSADKIHRLKKRFVGVPVIHSLA